MPNAITSAQLNSKPRHMRGACRSSMKRSLISHALATAASNTSIANSMLLQLLASCTLATLSTTSASQQPINNLDVEFIEFFNG